MSTIRAVLIVLFSCAVSDTQAAGLFDIGRQLILMEAHSEYCLPDLKIDGHIPALDEIIAALKAAMTVNAALLKPQSAQDELRDAVELFVEGWRADAAAAAPGLGSCDQSVALRARLTSMPKDELLRAIESAGRQLGRYDELAPLDGGEGSPLSYALPATRQNLLQGIRDNQNGRCPRPTVQAIQQISREPREAPSLPPFVLVPIAYTERWHVVCDTGPVWLRVTFVQDSEGPRGLFSVNPE